MLPLTSERPLLEVKLPLLGDVKLARLGDVDSVILDRLGEELLSVMLGFLGEV